MVYIVAGAAAIWSFFLNKQLVLRMGPGCIRAAAPFAEELCKTLAAYWCGVDIGQTHTIFGVIEGAYDWCGFADRRGLAAGLCSVFLHSSLGMVTSAVYDSSKCLTAAIGVAVLLHCLWNAWLLKQNL